MYLPINRQLLKNFIKVDNLWGKKVAQIFNKDFNNLNKLKNHCLLNNRKNTINSKLRNPSSSIRQIHPEFWFKGELDG